MMQTSIPIPELTCLLQEVEKTYGRHLDTSADFESLSVVIEMKINELISASTLKRLWGYVRLRPTPRLATLDILSRFIGHRDFKAFCEALKKTPGFESEFFGSEHIDASRLTKGQKVTICWNPNREVTLQHLGSAMFRVLESRNSKLMESDEFEVSSFIKGYPLFVSRILRNGEYTLSYIAGREGGLTSIRLS